MTTSSNTNLSKEIEALQDELTEFATEFTNASVNDKLAMSRALFKILDKTFNLITLAAAQTENQQSEMLDIAWQRLNMVAGTNKFKKWQENLSDNYGVESELGGWATKLIQKRAPENQERLTCSGFATESLDWQDQRADIESRVGKFLNTPPTPKFADILYRVNHYLMGKNQLTGK